MDKVSLTIDGRKIEIEAGATILDAAREAGIYIPTLCSHPDLPLSLAACRLCVVEAVGAASRFPSSCVTTVADGMVVRTNTPQVKELRRHFLKALLTSLPSPRLKRPQLKRLADYIGVKEGDLPPYVSRDLPLDHEQPLFEWDHNRCILCGLCVRACKELRKVGAIDFCFHNESWMVGPFPSLLLKDNGCRFCGACVEVCPTGAIIDKDGEWPGYEAGVAPCTQACPAEIDVPRYIWLISQKRFAEAAAVIREKVPFPGILGRVCPHPCEDKCRRAALNQPISIAALKRAAAERDARRWRASSKLAEPSGKRVAIVGSGPAGLTAGYYLAKLGHAVAVFESFPEPGGMMRVGIPEYRLPREVLTEEIEEIKRVGVEILTNTKVKSVSDLFKEGYDAVLLAVGTHRSSKLGIEGEDSPEVREGISFLRDVNLGEKIKLSGRVGVIGGGNAAIDSARTALRMGADEVTILYRRSRSEMPADAEQVDAALTEQVKIDFLVAPRKITRQDGILKVECIRMKLGKVDESGRRRPVPIEGSEFVVECDTLLVAIGEAPDLSFLGKEDMVQMGRGGTIRVDEDNLRVDTKGVFAAGDAVSGPATVIEAIAMGRKAAASIDKYLGGSGDISERLIDVKEPSPYLGPGDGFADLGRAPMSCLPVEQRMVPARDGSFPEVELGFTEEMASEEAKRCLQCQLRFQISSITPPPSK